MQITKIVVGYGRTHSLPDYCNVKPSITIEAALSEGDDPEAAKAELQRLAQAHVEEECDLALEEAGRKAHFWQGPRFDMRVLGDDWLVVILPSGTELPRAWRSIQCPEMDWRLEALRKYAKETYGKLSLIDLNDGNLEGLPDVGEYEVVWLNHEGFVYCLLLPADFEIKLLPDAWQNYRNTRYTSHTRLAANFLPWITEEAKRKEATLIDCLDGDLSKLPDLEPEGRKADFADAFIQKVEQAPEEDGEDWEDDEDDDFDDDLPETEL